MQKETRQGRLRGWQMTLNGRKLSQNQILEMAINASKPAGKVAGDGRAILRHDRVLVIQDQHETVAAICCPTTNEARQTVRRFR